jgi:hypothetical protein
MAMTTQEAVHEELQVYLEPDGRTSWKGALLSAVIGAGGGPLYRFVATPPDTGRDAAEHAVTGERFPLQPFQDLDAEGDDEWTDLARQRLAELDDELQRDGWRQREDRGTHWWSLRYTR